MSIRFASASDCAAMLAIYAPYIETTITFEQDDFEDMLQEAAEDAGLIGKRNSTAYVEFDYVTFSPLPSSRKICSRRSSPRALNTLACFRSSPIGSPQIERS